jgi:sialate O-acetylesterase
MDERNRKVDELDGISDKIFGDNIQFEKCTVPLDLKDMDGFGGFCGRMWFRKRFEIPADADISDALLILGTITDADKTYLNGKFVGETTYMYPPRIYPVPDGTAVHGTNTLLVCIDVKCGCGGFTKGKEYCLKLKDRLIDLSGVWEYAVAARVPYVQTEMFFPVLPLAMYAAMTAPAFNVKCRAMLWYQGETNCGHPERYRLLFEKFVNMYRERCGEQIPVIFTQLCNYDDPFAGGSDSWAELRAAQLDCLSVPGTDMAVTIDVGEDNDLHPRNKKDVGKRLALCVMRTVYGEKDIPSDIFCEEAAYNGCENGMGKVLLKFSDNARVRLAENSAEAFDICFANGNMIPALTAEMTESGLLLGFGSSEIPQKIRCEWHNAPKVIALRTAEGLPLSPFAVNIGKG